MEFDEDPFDDSGKPSRKPGARAGGRFQPRAKAQTGKVTASLASSLSFETDKKGITESTTQSIQPVDKVDKKPTNPAAAGTRDLKDNETPSGPPNIMSEVLFPLLKGDTAKEDLTSANAPPPEDAVFDSSKEVYPAGFELDPFADIIVDPATSNAGTGGRFQPKEQPITPVSIDSEATKFVQSVDIRENKLSAPSLTNSSELVATDALDLEAVVPIGCQDSNLSLGKSGAENADIFSGLESLGDFLTQSTGQEVGAASQFHHKVDMDTECTNNVVTSHAVCNDGECLLSSSERPVLFTPSDKEAEENGAIAAQTSVDSAAFKVAESIHDFETPDIGPEGTIASGRRARKFQPKPRVQTGKEKHNTCISNPYSDSANCQFNPSQTECIEGGSIPAFTPNDVFDYSSMTLGNSVPPDPCSTKLPPNEGVTNLAETSQPNITVSGDVVHLEDAPEMAEKVNSEKRKRKNSQKSKKSENFSTADEVNEDGKSSRLLRKRVAVPQLVDGPGDGSCDADGFPAGPSISSAMNEGEDDDEDNDDEYVSESSRKKRAPRKSKKPVAENEKPVKTRKKTNKAQDLSNQEPRKKFSHSTRRNKRSVDKVLLQTPEDEIDFRRLPIKDLILFAEYKERLAKKEEKTKTSSTPLTNQSNSFGEEETRNAVREEEYHSEDDLSASEQNEDFTDNQASYKVQLSSSYFNYQTYMNKAPSSRWSKQDTKLFYEAVQQFGTDFSMIQQLFPGRTRHQVKLKYKKEQRQHPLRLFEAETHRAKDHSHFEKVIEQLQQAAAAQAEQDADGDDSIGVTGDGMDEMAPKANEEAAKSEPDENAAAENAEADAAEVQNLPKPAESDDDDDVWDTYKSEY